VSTERDQITSIVTELELLLPSHIIARLRPIIEGHISGRITRQDFEGLSAPILSVGQGVQAGDIITGDIAARDIIKLVFQMVPTTIYQLPAPTWTKPGGSWPSIDPGKIVDQEVEWRLFEELLAFGDTKRVLLITGEKGEGKTSFLLRCDKACRRQGKKVSRVSLTHFSLDGHDPRPIDLAEAIVEGFRDMLSFPSYRQQRILKDSSSSDSEESHRAGTCIREFSKELYEASNTNDTLILIDSYEIMDNEKMGKVKDWFEERFLWEFFFEFGQRPGRLLLVICGGVVPVYDSNLDIASGSPLVVVERKLNPLEKVHIEDLLKLHGENTDEAEHWYWFYERNNWSIGELIQAIKPLQSRRTSRTANNT